jgi:preprotein translocase subunit YajC
MHSYLVSTLIAKTATKSSSSGSSSLPLIIIVALFVLVYIFVLRPRRMKMKAQQQVARTVDTGDAVVSAGGIHGQVVEVYEDGTALVEVAPNTHLRFMMRSLNKDTKAPLAGEDAEDEDAEGDDLHEALAYHESEFEALPEAEYPLSDHDDDVEPAEDHDEDRRLAGEPPVGDAAAEDDPEETDQPGTEGRGPGGH